MWKWIKKVFTKQTTKIAPRKNLCAPRKNNTIYSNDEFAQQHINKQLDNIFDKHHG